MHERVLVAPVGVGAAEEGDGRQREFRRLVGPEQGKIEERAADDVEEHDADFGEQRQREHALERLVQRARRSGFRLRMRRGRIEVRRDQMRFTGHVSPVAACAVCR